MKLVADINGIKIQAFPLVKDKINITSGTITDCSGVCCSLDGSILLVTYNITLDMVKGDVFVFDTQNVTIVSGLFHLA